MPIFGENFQNYLDGKTLHAPPGCENAPFRGLAEALADYALAGRLTAGARHVRDNVRRLEEFFAAEHIADIESINAPAIRRYLAGLAEAGRSAKTLLNVRGAISRFCVHLRESGAIAHNPCMDVRLATPEKILPPTVADGGRFAEMVRVAYRSGPRGPILANMMIVAVCTGLRLAEICRLRWADIDVERRTLAVRKAKGKRPRVVSLSRHALAALKRQRRLTQGRAWVLPARKTWRGGWRWEDRPCAPHTLGKWLRPVQAAFEEYRRLAGHSTGRGWQIYRHTCASELAGHNVNLRKIQAILGHTDIRMTERYTQLRRVYDTDIEQVFSR